MTVYKATKHHEGFYQELCKVLKTHSAHLPEDQLLAIACNFIGKLVAMQDQRKYTVEQVMDIVIMNIQKGNQQMIDELLGATEGNA